MSVKAAAEPAGNDRTGLNRQPSNRASAGCGPHVLKPAVNGDGALLEVRELSLAIHGNAILEDLSFDLHAGRTLGLIGESGSGKSMTALSIMRLLPRGSTCTGSIRFAGQELISLPESALCEIRGGDIGMVFQEPMTALNPVQTIGQQVSESIRLHRQMSRREAMELTEHTLNRVGLPVSQFPLTRYPHELSGGQRQRVVIAIAIACEPELLIADEPTTALDVTTQAGILDLLRNLQAEDHLGLILITHDLAVVSELADDVVVMRDGQCVEQGSLSQVFSRPSHAYTQTLFDASLFTGLPAYGTKATPLTSDTQPVKPELLEVKDLVCTYRLRSAGLFKPAPVFKAVDHVSFSLSEGQCLGLVGESGCGKSTLTRALLGLMPVAGGSIRLQGQTVSQASGVSREARQKMQVVFQDPYGSFNPRHKVSRLVGEPLHLIADTLSRAQKHAKVAEVLSDVGLNATDMDKFIHEFSGGQRQRIAIARALIVRPRLIILDEAVSALDVSVRAQVLELLSNLAEQQQLAYLFISHDLTVVRHVCDQILVMRQGQIVERGLTEQLFTNAREPYTQTLINAVPSLERSRRIEPR